ncbi:MAG: O-antigen ligase family protein [Eubacteriales bacterium]
MNEVIAVDNQIVRISKMGLQVIVSIYVLALFVVYPLYYENGYYNMGEAKYTFVRSSSLVCLAICGILLLLIYFCKETGNGNLWNDFIRQMSVTDYFALSYGVVVTISYIHSPYKEVALWGYEGWYMGLMSQYLFVLIYFLVSRNMVFYKGLPYLILGTASITHYLAILHRFRIDPLGMYQGIKESYFILFLSTIGQATWYSSYLCVVFPIGVVLYWTSTHILKRILLGMYVVIGAGSLVTQNSDSAFFALFFIIITLLLNSLHKKERFLRLLEIIILMAISFISIGGLQIRYHQYTVLLEPLSIFCSQSIYTKYVLFIALCIYGSIQYEVIQSYDRKKKVWQKEVLQVEIESAWIENVSILQRVIWGSCVGGIAVIFFLIIIVSNDWVPEWLSVLKEISYLNFNDEWGSTRGFTWKVSANVWKGYSPLYQLFGCGPDAFVSYVYEHHYDEVTKVWNKVILTNAHNEWFSVLLYTGVTGLITYTGIFLSQLMRGFHVLQEDIISLCVGLSIISYMAHNFFCYQQIVCTPLIFIMIGVGEMRIRTRTKCKKVGGKNGN